LNRTNHQTHECPDIASSTHDYAQRFSGRIGEYFLDVQWAAVRELLSGEEKKCRVLDVGGGHAQLAVPLVKDGYDVTVLGSDVSCRERLDQTVAAENYQFVVGDLLNLPFEERSFDLVFAFRMLPHLNQWRRFLGELCRVARGVIFLDYPDLRSVNFFSSQMFALKKKIENNTRPYRCFHRRQINAELGRHGFCVDQRYCQFFLPMALHRWLGQPAFSKTSESTARALGLTRCFGSPVILKAVRTTRE
jgi:ubiquinone/menaquinone biosynthesis C-methylase UbiE